MADPFIRDPDGGDVAGDADVASSDASQFMHKDVHDAASQAGAVPPEKMDDMLSPDTASVGDFNAPGVDMKAGDTSLVGKMELGTPPTGGGQGSVSTQEFNTPAGGSDTGYAPVEFRDAAGGAETEASPGSGAGFAGDWPGATGGAEGLEPLYGRGESAGGAEYPMPKMETETAAGATGPYGIGQESLEPLYGRGESAGGAEYPPPKMDDARVDDDDDGPSTLLGSGEGAVDVGYGDSSALPPDMPEVEPDPDDAAGA